MGGAFLLGANMSVITLNEYKLFKGINNPKQDTQLQPLIDAVNSIIEEYCQVSFSGSVATGVRLNQSNYYIILPDTPIISVEYLGIKRSSEYTEELDSSQYILHPQEGTIELIDPSINLPRNPRAFIVDYTYGYTVVPLALKQAAVELTTYYDKREFNKSKDIGNGQSVDFTDASILPSHIRTILDMFRVL